MEPRQISIEPNAALFRSRLDNLIDLRHELSVLADKIEWAYLDERAAVFFSNEGRPAHPTRLMVGLHLLKYMFNLSDDRVCACWKENPSPATNMRNAINDNLMINFFLKLANGFEPPTR